jgi:hypothetical protein
VSADALVQFRYDASGVIENDRWWFIPCGWIGSHGCIVNKTDLYVDWLGSATSLENALWGHDQNLFHDLVDFAFALDTPSVVATRLLAQFRHMNPNARGQEPSEPVPYRESEIQAALVSQFPVFRRHFVWYAISEIRRAFESDELRFTAELSRRA